MINPKTNPRYKLLAAHVTPSVYDALRLEAKAQNVSVSLLVSRVMMNFMKSRNYPVEVEP